MAINHNEHAEQRRSPRKRQSDAMFWRRTDELEYEMGWTLESSAEGLAFAWRGEGVPRRGNIIEVQRRGGDLATRPERAVIRRVNVAHDDLTVIAVQILPETNVSIRPASEVALKPTPGFTPAGV